MPAPAVEQLAPLRSEPQRSAVLLDVDGTLAPIVHQAADAHVPDGTRTLIGSLARRYGIVACVSGRRAAEAKRIVAVGSVTYVGNHGSERLAPGDPHPRSDPALEGWHRTIRDFARGVTVDRSLGRLHVRVEDKGPIHGFHWRGAPDERAARDAVEQIARHAEEAGLATHWGRKVLEVRPPVAIDKGRGVRALLEGGDVACAMYIGDDLTDLDAFRALRELVAEGVLEHSICVGVRSEEGPDEIAAEADMTVNGTGGVTQLLATLAED